MADKLKIYETMSRSLQEISSKNDVFGYYCCGPTVYGPAHIGNFRTFVVQDLFRRVAEFSGLKVRHVRNITDVDDKTIAGSRSENLSLTEFTKKWTDRFHVDCIKLNLLTPHVEPGAVEHIPEQIELIEKLIQNGLAYQAEDKSVYYKVSAFDEYGKLSHLDEREIVAGASNVSSDEYTKDTVADFALWKARKEEDGDNFWQSPWGDGRPGWHVECSAMSMKYLGESFDLHSGGVDLIFPHHENEIAQSEGATCKCFSRYWFHVTHLMVESQKMSKSLGNLYTIDDIEARGFSASDVRYVLLMAHYRKPLNFTWESLATAKKARLQLGQVLKDLKDGLGVDDYLSYDDVLCSKKELLPAFRKSWQALLNDLNTPDAFGKLFTALKNLKPSDDAFYSLSFLLQAFGIEVELPKVISVPDEIKELAEKRWSAKLAKNWVEADRLREELDAKGWVVKDSGDSYELKPS